MTTSDLIAHARVEFREFRIPHPRLLKVADEINVNRRVSQRSREKWIANGRKGPRMPHKFLPIIGPSGTGKSTCIKHYLEKVVADEEHDEEVRPVVHVTLSAQANTKRLGSDILQEYGDPDFEEGTAARLRRRAENHIEVAQTDVLVIDEIHHLINNDAGGKTAWSVTETLKRMLIRGTCPLILIGTEEASPLLLKNRQLKERCYPPIFLGPLDTTVPEEKRAFLDHCAGFDRELVEHRIFKKYSGLIVDDIPMCLYDVSQGVIGTVSNVCENATELAIRRGADCISRKDLDKAIQDWAIPLKISDYNPFRHGPRNLSVQRAIA